MWYFACEILYRDGTNTCCRSSCVEKNYFKKSRNTSLIWHNFCITTMKWQTMSGEVKVVGLYESDGIPFMICYFTFVTKSCVPTP